MKERFLGRIGTLTIGALAFALGISGIVSTPVHAVNAGSASRSGFASWAFGWEYYRLDFGAAWNWSSGNLDTSRISKVRGHAAATANVNNQVSNASGPTDGNRNPISGSATFPSTTHVYYNFKARSCLIKPLNLCGPWSWHNVRMTLSAGGSWIGPYAV